MSSEAFFIPSLLGDLSDVVFTALADNDVVVFDSASGKFINKGLSAAGALVAANNLGDLTRRRHRSREPWSGHDGG
jgi:hypothetical protein